MIRFLSAAVTLLTALTFSLTSAYAVENVWDYSVQVSSAVQASPARITLSWPQDTNGTPSSYTIYRKSPNDTSWGSGTTLSGSTTTYTDANVAAGTAYEYRIVKAAGSYTGYGYIQTGISVPLVEERGKVILIVDNTFTAPLASELARLERDLVGDGWSVIRHDVSRTESVANVKALIKNAYNSDPANVKSVFLFGHVPVPYSGQFNPDGHPDHVGAWPADVYYGDVDGNWTDNTVNYTQTINTDRTDAARISNLPGDGKFDQSDIPSHVELQVGRVDMANMPGRKEWGGTPNFASETELLRKYLNKDHAFRNRAVNPTRRAILGDYFGIRGGEAFGASGFRNFAPLVGAQNVRDLNREFNDQRGVWIPQAKAADYLLAYACGAGSYNAMSGIGNSGLYNGGSTWEVVTENVRGVFNLVFGSWLGDWDHEDSMLRAPLATDHGLVAVWSGRPHWFMHRLGLGETVGSTAQLTQNNTTQYQTQINTAAHRTHIALMGDPTLRLHPVVPVGAINGSVSGSSASLSWGASADTNIAGYHVYRGTSAKGPFTRLTSSPITATNYTDSSAPSGATYMVRAIKLENTTSGSYYNPSQGVFWSASSGSSGGATTPPTTPADITAPTVVLTSPVAGSTVSGTVNVAGTASDNVGVVGVQFKLDSANLGQEDTAAPYSTSLDTTSLSNGTHTLSAVVRDAAGNMASGLTTTITVNNTVASGGGTSGGTTSGGSTTGGSTTGTATTSTPSTTVPSVQGPISNIAGTVVWIDDSLPAGAGGLGGTGDTWNWVTSPAPFSGSKAHRSDAASGMHEHWFGWSNTNLVINNGEILFTYVYLDPANPPKQIMLSWSTSGSWNQRAYWGADIIKRGSGTGYYNAGALPETGKWVRLEVPASAVGLEGQTVTAMNFSCYDGAATWDASGKMLPTVPEISVNPAPSSSTSGTTSSDTLWIDDSLPAGAGGMGGTVDTWNWVTNLAFSGSKSHRSDAASGMHEHWFGWSNSPMPVAAGEKLIAYVYLDPANPPKQIMLSWSTNSSWNQRAYWGADIIKRGSGTGYYNAGALPATGKWVRLEVPASAVGLEGQTVTAMNFSCYDGAANWDAIGKTKAGTTSGGTTNGGTTTGGTTTGGTTTGGTTTGGTTTGGTTTGGTTTGGSTTGTTTTVTNTTTPTTTPAVDTVWIDDALPAGAGGMGGTVDTWNWTNLAYSGSKSHRSDAANGMHEHWFGWSNQPLAIATGDKLYTYVYLDPITPPKQIMIAWSIDGSWNQRAYWGADLIKRGTGTGYYNAGALPATGQWVRLEVPASAVGLEGKIVTGMNFTVYDGAVNWDVSGKSKPGTTSGGSTSGGSTSGGSTSTTPTTTTVVNDTVWIDDALPAGAGGMGGTTDTWNWVSTPVHSGSKAHRSDAANGMHEHWFGWSNSPLPIAAGDKLYAYVYLDPVSTPKQIMIAWSIDGSWNQRAYWGADLIKRGSGTGYYNAGALPAAGQWVRLEVPASAVGLEGKTVTGMNFSCYDGAATWDDSGKSTTTTVSGGSTSGGTSSGGTTTGGTTTGGTTTGGTTTGGTTTGTTTTIVNVNILAENKTLQKPRIGDYQLRVISPTVLELQRITTKQPDPATFTDWNFVDSSGNFSAPATSKFVVTANGQAINVSSVGFRRRTAYAPEKTYDLRIDNCLYLKLASPIAEGASVTVNNPDSTLWPSSMNFATKADTLRNSPVIHVNQEGYAPTLSKKAMIGYYLGSMGELPVDASAGFKLVNATTGATVHTGSLTLRKDVGYSISPLPYQQVYEADFTSFRTPGEYQLVVPGLGASLPFLIDDGVMMAVTRTYALGLYHQRSGGTNVLPYTRHTRGAGHLKPAEIPTASGYDFTWKTIASYSGGNSSQTAPQLTSPSTMLYPFVKQGTVDVSGGHFDAGDYSKYTTNVAQLAHLLMFTADSVSASHKLDNLGLPESGDGVSDILQEAKWEADFISKLQDSDGGFFFIVYPKTREYEGDVSPEFGDQQVVWPKNTSATAASVAALAQFASSPTFKRAYPDVAAKYLSQAKLGWQFLMNAHAKYGKAGAYQKITFYGDRWNDTDELAWAAAELFAATGEQQYFQKLKEWFPNPADQNTYRDNYVRMAEGWGNAIRAYAFAARSGRLPASSLDAAYLATCENEIKQAGRDALTWSTESAYGAAFSSPSKRFMAAGWYFTLDWACDMAVAYQLDPQQAYLDALTTNVNYELGANPVNVSFLSGLGLRRHHEFVSQYANTDRRVLPPQGWVVGHIVDSFSWVWRYGHTRTTVSFPADTRTGGSTPLQDRWSDTWNTSAEMVTVNLGRSMIAAAALAMQTNSSTVAWKPATTLKINPASGSVGRSLTLSVDTAGLNLAGARITWEAQDQQPDFGPTFTITPTSTGSKWVEVEITWPDGRRLFGEATFTVQ